MCRSPLAETRWQVLRHVHADSLATTPPPPKKKKNLDESFAGVKRRTRRRTAEEIVRDCVKNTSGRRADVTRRSLAGSETCRSRCPKSSVSRGDTLSHAVWLSAAFAPESTHSNSSARTCYAGQELPSTVSPPCLRQRFLFPVGPSRIEPFGTLLPPPVVGSRLDPVKLEIM